MRSTQFARSTRPLVWGLVLVVVGLVVWSAARQADLRDAVLDPSFGGQPGQPWTVIGGAVALVGLVLLVVGLVRLSTNVDLAAYAASAELEEREAQSIEDTKARFASEDGRGPTG